MPSVITYPGVFDGVYSPIVFSRASSGTYFNSAGVLTTAAANAPRIDYTPDTLVKRGMLIEEARANLSTNSVLASAWGSATNASYANTQALAPDGTNAAWRLTEDSANSSHFGSMTSISTSYTSGTTYTVSRFLKASGRNVVTVYLPATNFAGAGRVATFNLTTGNVVSTETGVTATIQNVGNGWYRCSASAVANATGSGHVGGSALTDNGTASYQGDGVSGAFVWGHQLEAGVFSTSYIPTTTAAVTRSADVASVNTLSPWFNAVEGTLFAEYVATNSAQNNAAIAFSDGTNNNRMIIRATNASAQTVFIGVSSGATQWGSVIATALINTITKSAFGYKTDDVAWVRNGGAVGTDTLAIIPAVTGLKLGTDGDGALFINGYLRRITYYPTGFTNAQLQALTA